MVCSRKLSAGRAEGAIAGAAATSLFRILAAIAALLTASGQFTMPDDGPPTITRLVSDLLGRSAAGFVSRVFFAQQLWDPLDEQA